MKKTIFILISFFLFINLNSQNQVTVTVMVNPPFSHDIRDYVNQPGKIMVMLTAKIDVPGQLDLYKIKLIGSITGDNGIVLRTQDSYRPPMPIELMPGQSIRLTFNDLEPYFTTNNLDIQGINEADLLSGKGLPEGTYTICMQAVDYYTNQAFSEEEPFGCSAPFDLRYIEPPQLLSPWNEDQVESFASQLVNFNWTIPIGVTNPTMIRYKFRLYEMPTTGINPETYVSSAIPPFYEQSDIINTSLIYNIAMPMLDIDKTYAWQVIAEDINGKTQFANNGRSEINTFSFQKPEEHIHDIEQILVSWPQYCSSDSLLISGNITDFYVSWIFSSMVNDDNNQFMMKFNNIIDSEIYEQIIENYKNGIFTLNFYSDKKAKTLIHSTKTTGYYYQANANNVHLPFVNGQSYWFQIDLSDSISNKNYLKSDICSFKYKRVKESVPEFTAKTISGNLRYKFQGDESASYPLSHVSIKLVKKYILKDAATAEEIEVPENEYVTKNNRNQKPNLFTNTLQYTFDGISSTQTNQNGNFSFQFNWPKDEELGTLEDNFTYAVNGESHTGLLSRVLRIEPQNAYYAPIVQNITHLQETTTIGNLTTYVYAYTLKAEITEGYQGISGLSKPLPDKNVYLIRKIKGNDIPFFEGDIKNLNQMMLVPNEIKNNGYVLIAKRKTILSKDDENNDIGYAIFTNLIQNLYNSDDYYLWIEGTQIQTAQRVRFKAASIPNTTNQGVSYSEVNYIITSTTTSYSEISDYHFTVKDRFTAISNEPPKSIVQGKLIYSYPGINTSTIRPLANTNISIIACYVTGPEGYTKIVKKRNTYEDNENAFFGTQVLGTATTNANGEFDFEFTNIPPQYYTYPIGSFEVSTGKLNRENTWIAWESDPEHNFRIKYEEKTGSVRRVFRIVVEDPYGLYMSPDDDIIIEPLQTKNIGTLSSNVFTYKIEGKVLEQGTHGLLSTEKIPGVECYLLRNNYETANLNLPEGEGQSIIGILDDYPDYRVICFDTTDSQGKFAFENVLFRNANAQVYFYYRTPKMKGTENYDSAFVSQVTINPFAKPRFFFNSDYNYSSISGTGANLLPAKPGIRGKVISNVNAQKGLKNVKCELTVMLESGNMYYDCLTDDDGYFDLSNKLDEINDLSKINRIILIIGKEGFYYYENGKHKPNWVKDYDSYFVQAGKQIVEDNIILSANGGLKGIVKNEKGEAIDAYVRFDENRPEAETGVGEGTLIPTWTSVKGGFKISAIPGNNRKLIIIPKDVAYFNDTILVNVKEGESTLVENIVIKERSHRIYFYVYKGSSDNISYISKFPGARVKLLDDDNTPIAIADNNGKVELNFKNVSVNHLSLQVSGPIGSNYVPKIVSFKNEESTTPVKLNDVLLKPGISISGTVKLDGSPTNKAYVYVELKKGIDTDYSESSDGTSNTESQYFFQTTPGTDGNFVLNCLPSELTGKTITIKAVYKRKVSNSKAEITSQVTNNDPEPQTVIGDSKSISIPLQGNLLLNLTTYNAMAINHIWGFPLEITKLTEIGNGNVKISGRVKLQGYSKGFDPIGSMTYEIKETVFTPSNQMSGNIPVGVPQQDKVVVKSDRAAKMKYAKSYNVELSKKPVETTFVIEKASNTNNHTGKLSGFVHIIDNSFQYPSSYLNFDGTMFYFANTDEATSSTQSGPNAYEVIETSGLIQTNVNQMQLVSPIIEIFKSNEQGNGNDNRRFRLCNVANENVSIVSNLRFKFINFQTTANVSNSYIEGTKITLDATLNATIQNAGDVSISIGKLVLMNNKIEPVSGNTPILITLKDGASLQSGDYQPWKIEAFDWVVDPQQGGLVSQNCMLHTGKLDMPIKDFNLRADFAYIGEINLQGINLGGYPIQTINNPNSVFGYNECTGSDKKGHWQLIIIPKGGGSAGFVQNLPHLTGDLQLETISLLSNGEDVFGIAPGAAGMKLYNTVSFNPLMLNTIPDGFVLSGGVDFPIPNVKQGLGTKLTFSKSSGDYSIFVDPINITFEGLGNVVFKPNLFKNGDVTKQTFFQNDRKFEAYGTVEEPGVLEPIQVKLTYDDKYRETKIVHSLEFPNQTIKIGTDNTHLSGITCSMNADATVWDHLTFSGNLDGFSDDQIDPNNRKLTFKVLGEIKGANQEFKSSSFSSSFGGISITYEKGRLLGSLSISDFPLGPALVTGTVNLLMDKDGWAFYSSAIAKQVPIPDPATINMGILIGNYPSVTSEMKNTVLTYAVKKEMPATFNNDGLKGFYLIGGRDLPIAGLDKSVDVIVAKAYVEIPMAGVNASFYMNTANGTVIGTRLDGGLQVLFGLNSITCTSLSGNVQATISVSGEYAEGKVNLLGESTFSGSLTASQGIWSITDCIDAVDLRLEVVGGFTFTPPFNVNFYLTKP